MASPDPIRVLVLQRTLPASGNLAEAVASIGCEVVAVTSSGVDAVRLAEEHSPEVVVFDLRLETIPDAVETAAEFQRRGRCALVCVASPTDVGSLERLRGLEPVNIAWAPLRTGELQAALEMAAALFRKGHLRDRRDRLVAQASQSLGEGMIGADLSGRVHFLNAEAERLTGWTEAEALGRPLEEIYAVATRQRGDLHSSAIRRVEMTARHGSRLLCEERISPVRDDHGGINGMVVTFRRAGPGVETTTSPRSAATAPSSQEAGPAQPAPLADIVESISDPLVALDARWNFTYVNSSAAKLFDREKSSLSGQNLWEVLPPSVRVAHEEELVKALGLRMTATREIFLEENETWFEARTYPFGSGSLLLLKDITSRKLEADRNHRMDRLESLGLLARGFAHDFNNLLTVLLGNLSLAEMRFGLASEKNLELHTAKQATLQAQNLVQQLLTFARGGAPIKRMVSLADLVKTFFYNHHRVDRVNYFVEVQEDMPEVAVDPNQLRRLLSNLVRNAELALRRGGEIRVRCEATDAARMFPNETLKDDPGSLAGVTIEVHDTGEGIPAKNLPRIFEPYFTTRTGENASGLGLTVCESIAKAHGGSISVSSQPGKGTFVRFFLPVDMEAEVEPDDREKLDFGAGFASRSELTPRILLLEDDHLVRTLILKGLEREGYEVEETMDGNETVRLYQEAMNEGRPFDLVVLDLSIPNGMGGLRTMEKLRALDSGVLAIVSSGYSDDPVMAQPSSAGFAAVLPKPYEPMELLRMVKSVLSARRNGRKV
jgi:PAS domain S-box-containing protein